MFNLFKSDPKKKLEKEYRILLEKAVDAQRNGKIDLYAQLSSDADKVLKKIESLDKE